jgi:hypothetical protein
LQSKRAIPIYHVHGFVPKEERGYSFFSTDGGKIPNVLPSASLVFTDEQYWRTVGNPASFAARLFSQALSGTCVFIGLSMTDINIIRWLALDSIERSDDFRRLGVKWDDNRELEDNVTTELLRHYWVTTQPRSPAPRESIDRVVERTLERRGVLTIDIPSWNSPDFHSWWRNCFMPKSVRSRTRSPKA